MDLSEQVPGAVIFGWRAASARTARPGPASGEGDPKTLRINGLVRCIDLPSSMSEACPRRHGYCQRVLGLVNVHINVSLTHVQHLQDGWVARCRYVRSPAARTA